MKTPFLLTLIIVGLSLQLMGQISSIAPQQAAKNHYLEFSQLSSEPTFKRAELDEIIYPPEEYRNSTLLFALVKPHYLSSEQVDFLVKAVNFPANSSDQTRAELDFLLELQAKRTPEQIERVMNIARIGYWPTSAMLSSHPSYEKNLSNLFFEVREVMGENHTPEQFPATTKLLQGAMNDMRLMEFTVKYHLLRARPYQLEPKMEPLREIGSPSFASGHTLWAYTQAYILAELIPDKRKAFLDLAYEIGFSREVMGVHYPSDEEVARQISHRMVWLMWHTDTFQKDFTQAVAEWR
ncbi:MAG: phosphatase PAP2 family protein [Bacteroidota bacterium]